MARDALPPGATLHDLGECRLRDLYRPERVSQLLHPDLPSDFPPLRGLESFPTNLPIQSTPLIGRQKEASDIVSLLRETRLLTLTGTAGVGKSRLALEVGVEVLPEFPGGVWLAEFASLADPALVPQTIASALGLRPEPGRPVRDALVEHLADCELLLILDNCEHLIEACAELAEALLRRCPRVRVLTTSRETLRVPEGTAWRVPSLPLPEVDRPNLTAATLSQYDAVRLFIERAVAARPGFAVTNANAPAVAQVCWRLDGIPLAIELAAARVRAMPVPEIAARLDDRFHLLTAGSRTALPRHQTLQALLAWSHDLLTERERTVFRRLAVFAGGWTLQAAEAVCAGNGVEAWEASEALLSLVDKSLVSYEEEPQERYRYLETIRQYALDWLTESGEAEALREKHAKSYLDFAERTSDDGWAADWADGEMDNLRAALAWLRDQPGSGEQEARLVALLGPYMALRGYAMEGWGYFQHALARASHVEPWLRASLLERAARLAVTMSAYRQARPLVEEAAALRRDLGDIVLAAGNLGQLGEIALQEGKPEEARRLLEDALEVHLQEGATGTAAWNLHALANTACALGDPGGARTYMARALALVPSPAGEFLASREGILGKIALSEGDYGAAEAHLRLMLEVAQASHLVLWEGYGLSGLSAVERARGDYRQAREHAEQSLAAWRACARRSMVAATLSDLGLIAWSEGDPATSHRLMQEALGVALDCRASSETGQCLAVKAVLLASEGQCTNAALLFGAVSALGGLESRPFPAADRAAYDQAVSKARQALGEEAFQEAYRRGRAMGLEEAITFAQRS